MIILILAGVSLSIIAHSETEERQTSYSLNRGGLLIVIEAPIQACPEDELNITIRVQALTEIHIDFIYANISCLKDNLTETLFRSIEFLGNDDLSSGETYEEHYEMLIPEMHYLAWFMVCCDMRARISLTTLISCAIFEQG